MASATAEEEVTSERGGRKEVGGGAAAADDESAPTPSFCIVTCPSYDTERATRDSY